MTRSSLRPDGRGPTVGAVRVRERIAALAAGMREQGGRPGINRVLLAHRALAAIDAGSRDAAYLALRSALCTSHEDLGRFETSFAAVFETPSAGVTTDGLIPSSDGDAAPPRDRRRDSLLNSAAGNAGVGAAVPVSVPAVDDVEAEEPTDVPAAASALAALRHKDFADYDEADISAARRIIARLADAPPMRRAARLHAGDRGRNRVLDLRRTLRSATRHGGMGLEPAWRIRGERPRRLVLVCDVSGSMQLYARMLLQFLQSLVRTGRQVEAFAFGTHLTRITRELGSGDPVAALVRATEHVSDWGAGTQIGASIAQLNREHGRRIGRGSVIVVLSDGLECGAPELLSAELARLRRSARALLWVNPHAADPAFEPLTRGMRAALPSTDELLAGNSIASLEELVALLETDPRFSSRATRPRRAPRRR